MKTLKIKIREKIALVLFLAVIGSITTSTAAKSHLPLAYAAIKTSNYPMSFTTALKVDLDIISVEEMRELNIAKSTLNMKM
jgi:hypothetical protein